VHHPRQLRAKGFSPRRMGWLERVGPKGLASHGQENSGGSVERVSQVIQAIQVILLKRVILVRRCCG
jgi:hypothetical protein